MSGGEHQMSRHLFKKIILIMTSWSSDSPVMHSTILRNTKQVSYNSTSFSQMYCHLAFLHSNPWWTAESEEQTNLLFQSGHLVYNTDLIFTCTIMKVQLTLEATLLLFKIPRFCPKMPDLCWKLKPRIFVTKFCVILRNIAVLTKFYSV